MSFRRIVPLQSSHFQNMSQLTQLGSTSHTAPLLCSFCGIFNHVQTTCKRFIKAQQDAQDSVKANQNANRQLLKGASAGRRELPGDLVWYTQDKGLRSYEELKSRVSN